MEDKKTSLSLRLLYNTLPGRVVLKLLTNPMISKIGGIYLSSRVSTIHIKSFINKSGIDMNDYQRKRYNCFNDFFTRKIREEKRPIDRESTSLISPCDGKLSIYNINADSLMKIKGSIYNVADLINNKRLAKQFSNGICLVFRLCVDDYHRYCYFDDGVKSNNIHIKGKLHTVQPIAVRKYPVYVQNSREYTIIKSKNFGKAVQIEVGAMMVGKILNHHNASKIYRGQEKGMFLFGGSTIVLLLQDNTTCIDQTLAAVCAGGHEAIVKMGEKIGEKY